MGQFYDYRNDGGKKKKPYLDITVDKRLPDEATLQRIEAELKELGYIDKAAQFIVNEKVSCILAVIITAIGFAFPVAFLISIAVWVNALKNAILLEIIKRKIKEYCENNN